MENIKKYLKRIWWLINPFNGATWIDRIMPPGSRKRIEYDKEQTEKRYKEKVENYFKLSDDETAEYWKGIDHRLFLKYQKTLEKDNLSDYEKWISKNSLSDKEVEAQEKEKFFLGPKISIVVPLYNTNTEFFRELLYSVHCQTYKYWELCLADGSEKPLEEIQKMVEKDSRIKYKFLNGNKGISENTNEAIKMATGKYIAFLDHDDLLEINALYEIARTIQKQKADFIYTDEDKFHFIDEPYFEPFFKPDFAIDTLRSNNYICHFTVIKKNLLDNVGYLNSELNGAQDYDLILRATEKAQKIVHIPKILYHWRLHNSSTSKSLETKPYVYEAGKKAIESSLERNSLKGKVNVDAKYGTYFINYDIVGNPSIAIVCGGSFETDYNNYKKYHKGTDLKAIKEDYVVLLDDNCKILTKDWIQKMLGFCLRKDVGVVGGKIYKEDKIYNAGYILSPKTGVIEIFKGVSKDENLYFSRTNIIQNLNAISGKMMMYKNNVISDYSGNAIDICLRFRKENYKVVFNPYVECEYSGNEELTDEARNEIISRWADRLDDKYYNINLSLDSRIYELKG